MSTLSPQFLIARLPLLLPRSCGALAAVIAPPRDDGRAFLTEVGKRGAQSRRHWNLDRRPLVTSVLRHVGLAPKAGSAVLPRLDAGVIACGRGDLRHG